MKATIDTTTTTTTTTTATATTATTTTATSATSSVNHNYFLNESVLDKVNAGNAASVNELNALVETFYKDVREFSRKAKKYAAAVIINSIARRNMTCFTAFYSRISSCGEIGKKIVQDTFTALQHACQENGKHEVLGKSFAKKTVKTKDGIKSVEFSFTEGVKSSVWTSALKWAKAHKHEILTFRLPKPDKKAQTWLDRLCSIACTYETARAKSMTGSESSVQSEQLERLNAQLDKLGKDVKAQVLDALNTLSSIELPE